MNQRLKNAVSTINKNFTSDKYIVHFKDKIVKDIKFEIDKNAGKYIGLDLLPKGSYILHIEDINGKTKLTESEISEFINKFKFSLK